MRRPSSTYTSRRAVPPAHPRRGGLLTVVSRGAAGVGGSSYYASTVAVRWRFAKLALLTLGMSLLLGAALLPYYYSFLSSSSSLSSSSKTMAMTIRRGPALGGNGSWMVGRWWGSWLVVGVGGGWGDGVAGSIGGGGGHGVASVQRDHALRIREAKRRGRDVLAGFQMDDGDKDGDRDEVDGDDADGDEDEDEDETDDNEAGRRDRPAAPKRIKSSPDSGLGFGPGNEDANVFEDDNDASDNDSGTGKANRDDNDRIDRQARERAVGQERRKRHRNRDLARGVSGLFMSETPALVGASRGRIECDVDVDLLAYWNDPQGDWDREFRSAFAYYGNGFDGDGDGIGNGSNNDNDNDDDDNVRDKNGRTDHLRPKTDDTSSTKKYISFQPDSGGWNNVRMSMENMFVFAAALGRTIVLPPPQPMYLLRADKEERMRGFADFYPLDTDTFRKKVHVISMEEFLMREGGEGGRLNIPKEEREAQLKRARGCVKLKKSDIFCDDLYNHLKSVGYVPELGSKHCAIFDENKFHGKPMTRENEAVVETFCGKDRSIFNVTSEMQDSFLIHFRTSDKGYRMVQHFYGYILFTDPAVDNYYKRFVRDFLHYRDSIYCAAGKIVKAIQDEGTALGAVVDNEGGGGYSSLHVRRGDLQYKIVKISAEKWYENTRDLWEPGEILYIATDERNKTFFDPIKEHHPVRFLDDYWELAGLGGLDPNYMGMIDTIVAARGRNFAGTFFSTFTGYIIRMRGYYGMSAKTSYYGLNKYKYVMHTWHQGPFHIFSHEWPTGWVGIDGDVVPSQVTF